MSVAFVVFAVLLVALLAVFSYRKLVSRDEDDYIHVGSDPTGQLTAKQQNVARTLENLDRMSTALTVITVIYGIALACFYAYQAFMSGSKLS